jgi:hypothetical protein
MAFVYFATDEAANMNGLILAKEIELSVALNSGLKTAFPVPRFLVIPSRYGFLQRRRLADVARALIGRHPSAPAPSSQAVHIHNDVVWVPLHGRSAHRSTRVFSFPAS